MEAFGCRKIRRIILTVLVLFLFFSPVLITISAGFVPSKLSKFAGVSPNIYGANYYNDNNYHDNSDLDYNNADDSNIIDSKIIDNNAVDGNVIDNLIVENNTVDSNAIYNNKFNTPNSAYSVFADVLTTDLDSSDFGPEKDELKDSRFDNSLPRSSESAGSPDNINYTRILNDTTSLIPNDYDNSWHSDDIDMVIIVRDQEYNAVIPLAQWKTQKGVPTKIINSSEYLTYDGRDTAEKIRNCLRDYYSKYHIKWVLLAGDSHTDSKDELIPIRYVYNPDTKIVRELGNTNDFEYGFTSDYYKPTDFYYAELTGNWDIDEDGKFGESLLYASKDEIDWDTEVYVGRFPARNAYQLEVMVNKTIEYERNPTIGDWTDRVLLGAGIQNKISSNDMDGEEEVRLTNKIIEESIIPSRMNYNHLYETQFGTYNLSHSSFNYYANLGHSIIFFAGHGSPIYFDGIYDSNYFFSTTDASTISNTGMPALFYADACSTNFFDVSWDKTQSGNSIGKVLMNNANGGAIGYIGSMRLSWYFSNDTYGTEEDQYLNELNRGMSRLFFQQILLNGYTQQGKALYEMKRAYLNSWWLQNNPGAGYDPDTQQYYYYDIHHTEWERKNVLSYNLLGDPETSIYTDKIKLFNETSIANQLKDRISGTNFTLTVMDENGNPVPNATITFSGDAGAYKIFKSNIYGQISVSLPNTPQKFTYVITKPNMKAFSGEFQSIKDSSPPQFNSTPVLIQAPTAEKPALIAVNASDINGIIKAAYIVCSNDYFNTYQIHKMDITPVVLNNNSNGNDENKENELGGIFEVKAELNHLKPNQYQYIIVIFDGSGNANYITWEPEYSINIPYPLSFYMAIILNIAIIGFIGAILIIQIKRISSNLEERIIPEKLELD